MSNALRRISMSVGRFLPRSESEENCSTYFPAGTYLVVFLLAPTLGLRLIKPKPKKNNPQKTFLVGFVLVPVA